jgi:hypothetical protein
MLGITAARKRDPETCLAYFHCPLLRQRTGAVCQLGSAASSGGTPEDLYQHGFLFGFVPVSNGSGSGAGGGGTADTAPLNPTPNPPTSGIAPNGQQFTCPGDFAYYGDWGGPGWSGGETTPLEMLTPQQQGASYSTNRMRHTKHMIFAMLRHELPTATRCLAKGSLGEVPEMPQRVIFS